MTRAVVIQKDEKAKGGGQNSSPGAGPKRFGFRRGSSPRLLVHTVTRAYCNKRLTGTGHLYRNDIHFLRQSIL
jgi:hypothetical protein